MKTSVLGGPARDARSVLAKIGFDTAENGPHRYTSKKSANLDTARSRNRAQTGRSFRSEEGGFPAKSAFSREVCSQFSRRIFSTLLSVDRKQPLQVAARGGTVHAIDIFARQALLHFFLWRTINPSVDGVSHFQSHI